MVDRLKATGIEAIQRPELSQPGGMSGQIWTHLCVELSLFPCGQSQEGDILAFSLHMNGPWCTYEVLQCVANVLAPGHQDGGFRTDVFRASLRANSLSLITILITV